MAASPIRFWIMFGGIWLLVGLPFLFLSTAFIVYGADRKTSELLIFATVGLVLSAAGGAIVVIAVRKERTRRRLMTSGVAAAALVTDVGPMNLRVNGRQLWRLKFEYRDYGSQLHRGSVYLDPDDGVNWKSGDTGQVLFDPQQPRTAVWMGRHQVGA